MKMIKYAAGIFFTLIIVVVIGVYIFLQSTLPKTKGHIALEGLSAPVEVIRDKWGVPHIFAQDKNDLFYAIGYVMAQDRLCQMDFIRRVGTGSLAEILGEDLIQTDHFLRLLYVMWPEERMVKMLRGKYYYAMEAYAAGVNEFIKTHPNSLSIEFRILGYKPGPWKITDGIYVNLFMGWDLQMGWTGDLTLMKLIEKVGLKMADEAMPSYPGDGPTIIPEGTKNFTQIAKTLYPLEKLAEKIPMRFAGVGGSNGWALSGKKTTTGMPILCQDPHLGLTAPSIWYELHINAEDIDAAGVTFPGFPAVVIGNNKDIAWGCTNVMLDDMDFYIEKINPQNPNQYFFKGKWEDMKVVETRIKVKGKDPVIKKIRITRHGPIINDVKKGLKEALAMRWSLNDALGALECFMGLNTAKNWNDFKGAVSQLHGPGQNMPYADRHGNIGYYSCARIPIRANPSDGPLPMPGWDGLHEWVGYVPFEKNPHLFNPEAGFVIMANNKTAPDDYPYYISRYFAAKYRAQRITQLIQEKEKLSVADNQTIQNDIYSIEAKEIVPIILDAFKGTTDLSPEIKQALDYLAKWDFATDSRSIASTIFHVTQMKLIENIFKDELGDDLYQTYIGAANEMFKGFQLIMAKEDSNWFDDISTTGVKEGRDDIIRKSIKLAIDELRERFSKDMTKWNWGELHHHLSGHLVFKDIKYLQNFFNIGPFPIGGSKATVAPAAYDFTDPYTAKHGASTREIIDFSDRTNDKRVITSGCSGQFHSKFYANQSKLWRKGEAHAILMDRKQVEENSAATLTLIPKKESR